MSFFDTITQAATEHMGGGEQGKVAGGLMEALDEHPGGLGGLLATFQQNGLGEQVQRWATGEDKTATPAQIDQGTAGTGLVEQVAAKAGLSPTMTKLAMAVLLPMVIAHFTRGGEQPAPASGFGGMAGEILGKLL